MSAATEIGRVLANAAKAARAAEDPWERGRVALVAAQVGEAKLAVELARELEKRSDEDWEYAALTQVYGLLGKPAEVERLRGRMGATRDQNLLTDLAIAYEYLGDEARADQLLDQLDDDGAAILAKAAIERGALARGEALYERSGNENSSTLLPLAQAWFAAGDPARALKYLERAEKLARRDKSGLDESLGRLSVIFGEAGRKQDALRLARESDAAFKKLHKKEPYGDLWHVHLARGFRLGGDRREAERVLKEYERGTVGPPSAWTYAFMAIAVARGGEPEKAEKWLEQAEQLLEEDLKRSRKPPDMLSMDRRTLAQAHLALGEVRGAVAQAEAMPDATARVVMLLEIVEAMAKKPAAKPKKLAAKPKKPPAKPKKPPAKPKKPPAKPKKPPAKPKKPPARGKR